nr:DNA topoisomerase I {peptide 3} [Micrococcus luteus, Peptide Partial, 16 aa] [Micrococcus luteus]
AGAQPFSINVPLEDTI